MELQTLIEEVQKDLPLNFTYRIEKSSDNRIWKFVMETIGKKGLYELGSFIHPESFRDFKHDICVSTMAGCPLSCKMCAIPYSPNPFDRFLTSDEIEFQIRLAISQRSKQGEKYAKNIIGFMGNGEPFLNIDSLLEVVHRLLADDSIQIYSFTISTTGVRPDIIANLADSEYGLSGIGKIQYSLMSMDPSIRNKLIPIGRSLQNCVGYLDEYANKTGQPIKYNIALIEDVNDSDEEARLFADFIGEKSHLRRAKISTFNYFSGVTMRPAPPERVSRFVNILRMKNVDVKMFYGDVDPVIFASCGQLRAHLGNLLVK